MADRAECPVSSTRGKRRFGDTPYAASCAIHHLLENEALKQLIQQQPDVWFEVRGNDGLFGVDFPEGVDQLYFVSGGVLKDAVLLKGLFELYSLTLMRLVEMDSAYDSDPNVRLREA